MNHQANYIGGEWIAGKGLPVIKYSPVDQRILWQANGAAEHQVVEACQSARKAFPAWSGLAVEKRIAIIQTFADLLTQEKEKIAQVISEETSKPLWETRTEIQSMIGKVAISIEAWLQRTGYSETPMPDGKAILQHRPHGVMAIFGPYNFPGHLPNGHIVPALIAGNTLVFKPSELTPLTAEKTMELWIKAGLPVGVLNLVQGGKETGGALLDNREIDGVLFTGSAATGFHFHRLLAGQPEKMLALEMGGNNALIVDDYDDIDAAVYTIIQSAFISAGQRCTCARRLLVKQGEKGDALIQQLVDAAGQIVPGHWNADPQPFIGGVISLAAVESLLDAQNKLLALGGRSLLTLTQPDQHSTFMTPGIIDLTNVKDIPDEEYFGPLLTVKRYTTFDEAISMANDTRFGLATGLISPDPGLFEKLMQAARAGIVNWNKPLTGASSKAPFGGIGASGNHRPSAYYAADYCAWPMASLTTESLVLPETPAPGLNFFINQSDVRGGYVRN
ncbi:succinylglutamate-semialdehyde dehydrogenase [Xenorhabdus griffiniae]|uniref:N-succinylglutamate 5-semialdehyde dehydrogenase n=1 Tax=Xenorhabdus griffiniae TaxID=351672 RepID=A0ABY9XLD8_9GAMM|nr:succinylglutamate-semialdehyde dehydrogenase [Xenorhabdus griffiniae]MBD1227402.1 succinylglutamate-semialdehyde dehydrogenase [Xenorhabdus griffiniae]MBE8588288.1 succinylglutamate-semialdehyde dehydrogenase [Xenorhabdus griffiniae]WMV73757.1 succinylglutamate-semialdehyde dehydrogenase [Xenorhabdus griffiniae]WNH03438.1 succinylglutamate-semialdehyde dehydrogenase [Xenorhabdus griffiniae]